MCAHVLLNLFNELRKKKIKCETCQAFYLFFCNKLNKFINTGAPMLDSIYHMTSKSLTNRKLLKNRILA